MNSPGSISANDVDALSSSDLDDLVPQLLLIESWVASVRNEVLLRLEKGESFTNARMVPKRAIRSWTDEETVKAVLARYLSEDEYNPRKLLSPAQAEEVLGKSRFPELAQHTQKVSSGLTLALGSARGIN